MYVSHTIPGRDPKHFFFFILLCSTALDLVETNVPRSQVSLPAGPSATAGEEVRKVGKVHFQDPSSQDHSVIHSFKTCIPFLLCAQLCPGSWRHWVLQCTHHSPPRSLCFSHSGLLLAPWRRQMCPPCKAFLLAGLWTWNALLFYLPCPCRRLPCWLFLIIQVSVQMLPPQRDHSWPLYLKSALWSLYFMLFNFFICSIYHYWKLVRIDQAKLQ